MHTTLNACEIMIFWKRQNNKDNKKIGGCQGLGRRGKEMNKKITDDI